jgi:hypothetical protein
MNSAIIPLMNIIENVRWHWYGVKRIYRLVRPEPSARLLIACVGRWWLVAHGVRREYRIYPWRNRYWYAADLASPGRKRIVEADGSIHYYTGRRDIVRDQRLTDLGWRILRVKYEDMRRSPKAVRKRVRKFLKGK